jgi:predicted membrane-bound spermidine synthase
VANRPGQPRDLRLFLNGDLQFSSVDEYRYPRPWSTRSWPGPACGC